MSIAVLSQVYGECRRLAAAGSQVARGDFRLKKLLPPLDAAGAKAPVFARVAEAARGVVDGPADPAGPLLELTALVTAVLYTQGDTAVPGEPVPIPSHPLGGSADTSARLLKPLLEALTTTGPGRLEVVKDGFDRGAFADLRLVGPALAALDDHYAELADYLAETVVPTFGPPAVPLVRAAFDPKGSGGAARRLAVLYRLDPAGTADLVNAALDGSKEVQVAAVACLGADDLPLILEQAKAKNKEVRAAAYRALARLDHPDALAALATALAGKDWERAADAIHRGGPAAGAVLADAIRTGCAALSGKATKKELGERIGRLGDMLRELPACPAGEALLIDLFARRGEFAGLKGEHHSGADLIESVTQAMLDSTDAAKRALVAAHADLPPQQLDEAAEAGLLVLSPAEFYDTFSRYLADGKKVDGYSKRAAVLNALDAVEEFQVWMVLDPGEERPAVDPRWAEAGVRHHLTGLVGLVGRADQPAVVKYLSAEAEALLGKKSGGEAVVGVVAAMVQVGHPQAADTLARACLKARNYVRWMIGLIERLPASAVPVLEPAAAQLPANERDLWARAVEELRAKA